MALIQPLISCLCVTKNIPEMVKSAINDFNSQTYKNKELILVTDEQNPYKETLEESTCDNIKLFYAPHGTVLGDLRNMSVDNASGEYIMIWDDDDAYHKDRIKIQYEAIVKTKRKSCFLRRVVLHDRTKDEKTISLDWTGIEASMLALKESMPRYQSLKIAEDTPVRNHFLLRREAIIIDKPELYTYNLHGDNTCKYEHLRGIMDASILLSDETI